MTNDKQRERLVELIEEASAEAGKHFRETMKKILAEKGRLNSATDIDRRNIYEVETDYLLANGIIVLPCKVGDTVYVIKRCRCGMPENYELKACGRKITERTPKVLARVMRQETGRRLKPNYTGKIEYEVVPKGTICDSLYEKRFTLKMLTEIGKTVFLTKEEAEQALKVRKHQKRGGE